MSQVTDRAVGANPSGFDMRTELNNIISALESDNSGSSEPLNTVAYMKWLDTSNATYYYYKERNHDNTAWVTLFRYTVATKIMEAVSNGVVISQTNIANEIHNATSKTTPVDTDEIGIADSAASFGLKKLTWANLKATLFNATNIIFGGTAQRIQSDFTNGTIANSTLFQTSTANSITRLGVIPNGTGNNSQMLFFNSSDPANSSILGVINNSAACIVRSSTTGSGTQLPLQFQIGATTYAQIDTSGNFTSNGVGLFANGQTWQDLTSSRALSTTYTNTSGKAIMVSYFAHTTALNYVMAWVNGVQVASSVIASEIASASGGIQFIVPSGATYQITTTNAGTITKWFELR